MLKITVTKIESIKVVGQTVVGQTVQRGRTDVWMGRWMLLTKSITTTPEWV